MRTAQDNEQRLTPKQGKIVLTIGTAGAGQYDQANAYHILYLTPPVRIPAAQYVSAKLVSASVWNSVPNIFTGVNDTWDLAITDSTLFPTEPNFTRSFVFTIPQGQYNVTELINTSNRVFLAGGLRADTLNITPDLSTSYTLFSTGYLGGVVIKANTRSLARLFGLDVKSDFAVPTEPLFSTSPNRAAFNTINSFVLHSTLASPGMPINARTSNILGVVPITAKPNRLVNYTPAYPIEINSENLQGSEITQVISYWTTEDGSTRAPMFENFTYTVEISYYS